MALPLPSKAYLDATFRYEPETGHLYWRERGLGRTLSSPVGHIHKQKGHVQVMLDGSSYLAHRIIWKIQTGKEPPHLIDHINHDPADNSWDNLREATHAENAQNTRGKRGKKLLKGVWKTGNVYSARLTVEGDRIYLGTFPTEQEAHDAYCKASEQLHGMFGCTESRPAA